MKLSRIAELRKLAEAHKGKTRSADIILECLDDIVKIQRLYELAIDSAFGSFRDRAVAKSKLKKLVRS